jgi:SAM-dependent methyltransferase
MIPTQASPESPILPADGSWDAWLASPPGQYVLNQEQQWFDKTVVDVFGFNAVQIGLPQLHSLRENRMPMRALLADCVSNLNPLAGAAKAPVWHVIESLFDELPFAAESVDLLVLPHVLEFANDPHQILREADRVLVPEGRLILSGFNPASLWGARQYFGRLVGKPFLPKEGQFINLLRIRDWLKLLNFSLDRGHFACYKLPLQGESAIARMNYLEPMGNRWWPIFGAVFMVSAVKRHPGIRLVGRVSQKRPQALRQLNPVVESKIQPTTPHKQHDRHEPA